MILNLSLLLYPPPKCLLECKYIIHKEIPERNHTCSNQLNDIEITLNSSVQQIYHKIINRKADERKAYKTKILLRYMRVCTRKCPHTIKHIVRCRCAGKTQRVRHILVQSQPLFGNVCNAEIDKNTRAAYYAKLDKSLQQ